MDAVLQALPDGDLDFLLAIYAAQKENPQKPYIDAAEFETDARKRVERVKRISSSFIKDVTLEFHRGGNFTHRYVLLTLDGEALCDYTLGGKAKSEVNAQAVDTDLEERTPQQEILTELCKTMEAVKQLRPDISLGGVYKAPPERLLEAFISRGESQQMSGDRVKIASAQKKVTLCLQGKEGMDWPRSDFACLFDVLVIDSRFIGQPRERSETAAHRIKAGITWKLRVNWRLADDNSEMDVAKLLFEHCREHVTERVQQGLALENEILLTTQNSPDRCPYDISRIADLTSSISFTVNAESQSFSTREIKLYVEDIDSFSEVQNVQPQEVKALLPLDLLENEIQTFLEEIIGENFHQEDWGGELNDLVTSHVKVDGKRVRAAFLLKGRGTRGKLTIAKCGKHGDQIVRLFEAPVDLYIIQHVGEIDQRVIYDLEGKAELKISKGEKCRVCIIDGTETARILKAYGKI